MEVRKMHKIDKNIPFPSDMILRNTKAERYPWKQMDVGDSVKIPMREKEDVDKFRNRVCASYRRYGNEQNPMKRFTYRFLKDPDGRIDGLRVWRLHDYDVHE